MQHRITRVLLLAVFLFPAACYGTTVPTATPVATASPTPTQHPIPVCGNGVVECLHVCEQCDDGNSFGGDGCALCRLESFFTAAFEPIGGIAAIPTSVLFRGTISYATTPLSAVVQRFDVEPINEPQVGTVCVRGTVPPDERYGPGNIGRGTFPSGAGENPICANATLYLYASHNIANVHIFLESWLNPLEGFRIDQGPDGVPCTEDDPGREDALVYERDMALALRSPRLSCVCDADDDRTVTVEELVSGVNNALSGCPAPGF